MDLVYRLNQLSPKRMTLFLTIITLTVPYMALITGSTGSSGAEVRGFSLVANLWMVRFGALGPSLHFLDLSVFLISTPNLLFVVLVYYYCKGRISWKLPVMIGLIPILFQALTSFGTIIAFFEWGILIYTGPLPIYYIIGLLFMRWPGVPKVITPWDEEDQKEPWWNA